MKAKYVQMNIECDYLTDENRCDGLYKGFGCIKDKCQVENKKRPEGCIHKRQEDGFCEKLGKLFCPGGDSCSSFETI